MEGGVDQGDSDALPAHLLEIPSAALFYMQSI